MITHCSLEVPKLQRVETPEGRRYATPSGAMYPSVTSVTGLEGAEAIQAWRMRVGYEEANRISARASKRGTAIHGLCEDFLNNKFVEPTPFDVPMWNQFVPQLDKIDNVYCLETKLYSDTLQVAGTVDCIADYEGRLSVIDFKTSGKTKSREDIYGYFMQCSAYCHMFMEHFKKPVSQMVIIMGRDDDNSALIFKEKYVDWIGEFKKLREKYRLQYKV